MNAIENVHKAIAQSPQKAVLFAEDFKGYGSEEAIKSALHRLVKAGEIKRLAKGIYVKPGYSELLQSEITPPLEEVANAIARRDCSRLVPSGAMAMYKLGLTTQIPLNLVFLTEGSARKIKVGNRTITFKRVTPKKLALKGEVSKLVVLALGEIGKDQVDEKVERQVVELLKKEKYETLKHDIRLASQWMKEIMAKAL